MRIHVISDTHFEHMWPEHEQSFWVYLEAAKQRDPANLLVIAGDFCQIGRNPSLFKHSLARIATMYDKVVFVTGNHEYYRTDFAAVRKVLANISYDPLFANVHFLDDAPLTYEGQRFIGGTMWFPDLGVGGSIKSMMADFNLIGSAYSPFEPAVYEEHKHFVARVMGNLRAGDVVVTHHGPLPASIDALFANSPLNPFFVADMTQHLTEGNLPSLWVQGHTHMPLDYTHRVGTKSMRVYCNPLAYPGEHTNSGFFDRIGVNI